MATVSHVTHRGDLAGKVALIVGAASGIGRATAEVFAREGASLVLADITAEAGQALAEVLAAQTPAVFIPVDVSSSASVQALVQQARQAFPRLNCLVNSAGVEGEDAPLHKMSEAAFDRVVSVNLRGAFLLMKYAIPWILEGGGGSVVNVASAAGMVGAATMAAYCSSKGGLIELGRVAACDYAMQGLRVNTVCPGVTDTPMMRRELVRRPAGVGGLSTPDKIDNLINRSCDAHEVAEAILFLSSDRAPFVMGTELVIDGGKLTR